MHTNASQNEKRLTPERAIPFTRVNRLSRRAPELTQDVILVGLTFVPFVLTGRTLFEFARDNTEEYFAALTDWRPSRCAIDE